MNKSWSKAYIIAIAMTGLALLIGLAADHFLEAHQVPYIAFLAVIMFMSWYGGVGPGLLAIGLGAVAAIYFILEPRDRFQVADSSDWVGLIFYLGIGIFALTGHWIFTARQRTEMRGDWFRTLVTATDQIIWTTNENGQVVEDSPSWRDFTGQTFDQWKGRGWLDAIHPDDQERTARTWLDAVANKSIYQAEYRVRTRDGGYRWMAVRAVPFPESGGRIQRWVGTNTDIHDRKQAEEALSENEEWLRALIASSPLAIVVVSPDTRVRLWNNTAEKLFGWTEADVLGQPAPSIPENLLSENGAFFRAVTQGETRSIQTAWQRRDNSLVDLNITTAPLRDKKGEITHNLLFCEDISVRRHAEQLQTEQTNLLELIATGHPLDECFTVLTGAVSRLQPETRAIVLMADDTQNRFVKALTKDIPLSFGQAIVDQPETTVLYDSKPVTFTDIARDEKWSQSWRDLCVSHNIRAYHSEPVLGPNNKPLASFMMCFNEAREPSEWEHRIARFGAHIASIVIERERSIRDIRQREQHLSAIVRTTPECVTIVTADGKLLEMNSAGLAMVEAESEATVTGGCVYDLIAPEYRDAFREFNEKICRGESGELQFDIIGLRGTRRHMETHAVPLHHSDGAVAQLALTRDITDRKRAEEALRENEEQFRAAFHQTAIGMAQVDFNGRHLLVNDRYCQITGYSREELLERTILDITHPADIELNGHKFQQLFAGQTPAYEIEKRYVRKDGQIAWVHVTASFVRDAHGKPKYIIGAIQDISERKNHEQTLLESEERFRILADTAPLFIAMADETGNAVYFNKPWLEWTGQPMEKMRGLGWLRTLHPDDAPKFKQAFKSAFDRREPINEQYRFRRADGEYRWMLAVGAPRITPDGRFTGYFGTYTDFHELKQAEENLKKSEARKAAIFESSLDAILTIDQEGNIIEWNAGAERIFGYSKDQVIGKDMARLIIPERFRDAHNKGLSRYLATNKGRIMGKLVEMPALKADGKEFLSELNITRISIEGPPQFTGVLRDITERKKAEDATFKHSEQVRRLAGIARQLNTAPDVTSIVGVVTEEARDLIGAHQAVTSFTKNKNWAQAITTVSLSDKYAKWRGYNIKPTGAGIYSLVCQTNKPLRMTQAELESHGAWKGFGNQAGNHPPMRGWLVAPLVGRDGRNIGLIQLSDKYEGEFTEDDEWILVQMAQMASVAIENTRLVENLRETGRQKDEFLAILAHELRNPLAPLYNMLEAIKRSDNSSELIQQAHMMMHRQLAHMVRLIDDLLDVSRVSRGKFELRRERVELASVLNQAVESARVMIDSAGHQLNVTLPSKPVFLYADPVRLTQIFGNLLNNACKYTDPGGRIWLSADCRDDEVIVKVRDTGIGIPAEKLESVFDMFTQVDQSLDRLQGGLGIGLTLVRQLVEMHNGEVTAHSAGPGKGAEFVVRLPVRQDKPEPGPQGSTSTEERKVANRRILVVDDNRDSAQSLALLLEMTGNETHLAHDGLQAVESANGLHPDVILLDIGLPKLNGYEVCRQIRQQPWSKNVLVIAISGWGQEQDKLESEKAGFDHHLVKPVDFTALTNLLAS